MADSATLPTIDLDYPFECVLENYSTAYLEMMGRGERFDDLTQFMEHRFDEALAPFYHERLGARHDRDSLAFERRKAVSENQEYGVSLARCLKIDAIDWVMENADA